MNKPPTKQAVINSIDAVVRANIPNAKPETSLFAAKTVVDCLTNEEAGGIPIEQITPRVEINDLVTTSGSNLDSLDYIEMTLFLEGKLGDYLKIRYEIPDNDPDFSTTYPFNVAEFAIRVYRRLNRG